MAEQDFRHSPISHDHIRLLSLERVNGELYGELEAVLPDPSIVYVAISYCWGEGKTSRRIWCNNKSFAVSENLYAALETISRASSFKFWVDAICIDQSNDEEKRIQVRKMSQIYRDAAIVVVWLGKSESDPETLSSRTTMGSDEDDNAGKEDTDIAIESLEPMVEYMATLQPYHLGATLEERLDFYGLAPISARIWRAFRVLLSRPWFSRLWVMQEVFLAKDVYLLCGTGVTWLEPLLTLCHHIERLGLTTILRGPHASCQAGLEFVYWFNTTKQLLVHNSYLTLYVFISLSRNKIAKEPVDHIYGMLGMVNPALCHEVRIDYSPQSKEQYWGAFINFAKSYVRIENNAEIFHMLSLAASEVNKPNLPSWVPNFNSRNEIASEFIVSNYRAGISDLEKRDFRVNLIEGTNHLELSGFRLDDVCQVVASGVKTGPNSKVFDSHEETVKSGTGVAQWEWKCLALSQKVYNCPPHEIPFAHKCTMVAESHPPGCLYPIGKEFCENYEYARCLYNLIIDPLSSDQGPGVRLKDLEDKSLFKRGARYLEAASYWAGHPFFVTSKGRIGLGPARIQPGDVICVLYSGGPLYVLRYESESKVATLIGDAYVYGCMDLDQLPPEERGVDETFIIG